MSDAFRWPALGVSKQIIALALAAAVLALSLGIAPVPGSVPLIGGNTENAAADHTYEQVCTTSWETVHIPSPDFPYFVEITIPIVGCRYVPIAHTAPSWWENALIGGSAGLLCAATASPIGPIGSLIAGFGCGAAFGALS